MASFSMNRDLRSQEDVQKLQLNERDNDFFSEIDSSPDNGGSPPTGLPPCHRTGKGPLLEARSRTCQVIENAGNPHRPRNVPEGDTQALSRKPCSRRRSSSMRAKRANSESERTPRQGKTRQVIRNPWSDNTRRRSRDMPHSIRPGIALPTRYLRVLWIL